MAALGQAILFAVGLLAFIDDFLMAQGRDDLLIYQGLTALCTDRTVGQTGLGTGGRVTGNCFFGVLMAVGGPGHIAVVVVAHFLGPAGGNVGMVGSGGGIAEDILFHCGGLAQEFDLLQIVAPGKSILANIGQAFRQHQAFNIGILEGSVFNGFQSGGQCNRLQQLRIREGIAADDLHGIGNDHFLDGDTFIQDIVRDPGHAVFKGDLLQCLAAFKGGPIVVIPAILIIMGHGLGDGDLLDVGTGKGFAAQPLQGRGQCHLGDQAAVIEGPFSDFNDGIREIDTGQSVAGIKGVVSDLLQLGRQDDAFQCDAALEGSGADLGDRFGDQHRGQ